MKTKGIHSLGLAVLLASTFNVPAEAKEIDTDTTKKSADTRNLEKEPDSSDKQKLRISQIPQAPAYGQPMMQNPGAPQDPFYSTYSQQAPPTILPYGKVLVSTTHTIPGFRVAENKGIVRGDVVFGPTILQAFKSSLKAIIGGKIGGYTQMCQRARENAFEDMLNQARQLGANAVVGIQYDSSTFSTTNDNDVGTEVFCYGTAVTIVPER